MVNKDKRESTDPQAIYQNKTRVRVCGLLIENEKILLLKHLGLGPSGFIWSPPGGGIDFGESVTEALIREFKEETNLVVSVEKFLFINEYRDSRLHAIELFFRVSKISGEFKLGSDPENEPHNQILTEGKWFEYNEIKNMVPETIHNCFRYCEHPSEIFELDGIFEFENI